MEKKLSKILFVFLLSGCVSSSKVEKRILGLWKLDRFEVWNATENRWEEDPTRIGYGGSILYDGQGHMALHLSSNKYKNVQLNTTTKIDSLTIDELRKLAKINNSMYFYFANYKLVNNKKTVEHHKFIATVPEEIGTIAIRDIEFKGDTLVLTPQEKLNGRQLRVRWIKPSN